MKLDSLASEPFIYICIIQHTSSCTSHTNQECVTIDGLDDANYASYMLDGIEEQHQ